VGFVANGPSLTQHPHGEPEEIADAAIDPLVNAVADSVRGGKL
jgi:hypothetical protein